MLRSALTASASLMRTGVAAIALLTVGCGGDSSPLSTPGAPSAVLPPTPSPTPSPAPPTPFTPTFTGTVTDALSGTPVSGFTATISGLRLLVSAPGYVTRDTRAGASTVGLIPERGFDVEFYRQLARGGLDGDLLPLRVLRQSPSFYMEVEGEKGLSAQLAAQAEQIVRRMVPELTGGVLHVQRWETGPTPRAPQEGWIMIERRDVRTGEVCGSAFVGATAGQIYLDGTQLCHLSLVIAHEVGHALGFWHVDTPGSLMFPRDRVSNISDAPTELERRHMAIAYTRPRGNLDLDVDP